jgi:hypothetical protein
LRRVPDLDESIGADVPAAEHDRLRAVHELLVRAGPPPELSPELESVPWPEEALEPLGLTRRAGARGPSKWLLAAGAAAAVSIGFALGQVTGGEANRFDVQRAVEMSGTRLDRDAAATLELGSRGPDGNLPMLLHVQNLLQLPPDGYYNLYLTRAGKPIALCGSFNVKRGVTVVRMNVPYELKKFDGWVVTRQQNDNHKPTEIVLKT